MSYPIDIQHASTESIPVKDEIISHWVSSTLKHYCQSAELTLRLVDPDEMIQLNHTYRKQNKLTNVLAFPASHPDDVELDFPFLGDIVICASVLKEEAETQDKPLVAHWAHIVIHGVLHLLGYDHIEEGEASIMQAIEIKLLAELGFDNPYEREVT